ncbi:hypothetical protein HN011_007050 [Eciton burchellii]|jgi:hypothetical protein|nr:hypothetical protein HN011_007050 [Eciton burchellii]
MIVELHRGSGSYPRENDQRDVQYGNACDSEISLAKASEDVGTREAGEASKQSKREVEGVVGGCRRSEANGDFSRAALTWAGKSMGPPTPTRTRSTEPCTAHVHNVALYARTYDTVGQQSMRDRLGSYVSAIKFVSASQLARLKVPGSIQRQTARSS